MSLITLQEFINMDPNMIKISVSKFNSNLILTTYEIELLIPSIDFIFSVQKRYTEFQGLYDSLTIRYQKLKFPEFPSKFQLYNKKEKRRIYFDSLLRTIHDLACKHISIKKDLLKLLYEFVFSSENVKRIKQQDDSCSLNTSISRISLGNEKMNNLSFDENISKLCKIASTSGHVFNITENSDECKKDGWSIEFKILKDNFSKGFMRVMDHMLFLFDSILSNNFFLCLPLYGIKFKILNANNEIEILELADAVEYLNANSVTISLQNIDILVIMFHPYDNSQLIIKFNPDNNQLNDILKFINVVNDIEKSKPNSRYIGDIDETNSFIYGKVSLDINNIVINGYEGNLYLNISLPPYNFKTKSVISTSNFSFKQVFLLPIHNRFDKIHLELYSKSHTGFLHKKTNEEKLCDYNILIPEIVNNIYIPNKIIEVELENTNKSIKTSKILFYFKLKNFTSNLSLMNKNRNKNVLENMSLHKSNQDFNIKMLLKRMKKIIILIKEWKEYYKTIFRFKYPVFSTIIFFAVVLYFMFFNIEYFLIHLLFFMSYIIFIYSNVYKIYFSNYADRYIFSIRNPYDFESFVSTKVDLEEDEVKKNNYLTEEKKKKNIITNYIIEPIKNYKHIKDTYNKALFKFTNYVSILEKTKNLFLWSDPLPTIYFFFVLVISALIIYAIKFRYLMLFSLVKKFISGLFYYKKKFTNNKEIANLILSNSYKEWFLNKKKNDKIDIYMDSNILNDEKFKIFLKEQLEKHADIYIKSEFLNSAINLNEIKNAIMKCRTLLKLKKDSILYKDSINNENIYRRSIEIESIFYYFVQNIKSDYYISKFYKQSDNSILEEDIVNNQIKN